MIGRNWRAPIGLLLALNSSLGRNRAFSLITLASIAASVALATSLEISSRAVQDRADRTARALSGSATLEVVGGGAGIPESLVSVVSTAPGVAIASPMINAELHTPDGRLPIHVIGFDLLSGSSVQEFEASAGGVRITDPLRLLARPDAIVVSNALAEKLNAGLGASILLRSHLELVSLRVEGILSDKGIASAFGSQVAVMDVYALQALMGRQGFVDRIDVVPSPGTSIEKLETEVARAIEGVATVRRVDLRGSLTDRVLAAVRRVVVLIAAIGALAAGLVNYSAMSMAVERRLPEFSLLRSTGMSASAVRTWILAEASALSVVGTAAGSFVGSALGRFLVPVMLRTTDYLAESSVDPDLVGFSWSTLGIAVGVGACATMLRVLSPARIATRRFAFGPARVGVGAPIPVSTRLSLRAAAGASFALLLVASAVALEAPAVEIGLTLGGGTFLAWWFSGLGIGRFESVRPALNRLVPQVGHLIGTGLQSRARGSALAVATIAGLVGFVVAIVVLASSFSTTIVGIVESRYSGAIMITAGPLLEGPGRESLSRRTIDAIESTTGVVAVAPFDNFTILHDGEEVDIVAIAPRVALERGLIILSEGTSADVQTALERGAAVASDAFLRRFSARVGDSLELRTSNGARKFEIAGAARALAGPAGVIYVDNSVARATWGRTSATSLMVWPSSSPELAVAEIRERVADSQDLFFMTGDGMRRHALRLANRFDSMIVAVAALAAILSAIGVANLLVGLVADRRLEFSMLRAAGASATHLSILVVCDAILVVSSGLLLGSLMGLLVSIPALELLRDDFGLTVERSIDPFRLALFASVLVASAIASALYPAAIAHRRSAAEVLAID